MNGARRERDRGGGPRFPDRSLQAPQLIGEGGFGVVYRAEQEEPVRRKVARIAIELHPTEEERARAKEIYDDWFAALPSDLLDWKTRTMLEAVIERARNLGWVGVPVRKPG